MNVLGKNGLKVVTLPYLNLTYRSVDEGFGDYALFNVSPNDFYHLLSMHPLLLQIVFMHLFFTYI